MCIRDRDLPVQSGAHPEPHHPLYRGDADAEAAAYHIEALYDTLSKTPCGQYVGGKRRDLSPKQQKRTLSGTTLQFIHFGGVARAFGVRCSA